MTTLAVAFAPENQFPTQLRQASAALSHLLASGISPSDIILGGDSAGGNINLTLLAHILHPHADVEQVTLPSPVAGVLLISPGVHRDTSTMPKHTEDSIHPRSYVRMYASMPIDTSPNAWPGRQALHAPDGWWTSLSTITPRVLYTAGTVDTFGAQQIAFARRLEREAKNVDIEIVVEEGAVHDNPVSDMSALGDGPGVAAKRIASWIAEL
jgi:acetyl esterase/lipase